MKHYHYYDYVHEWCSVYIATWGVSHEERPVRLHNNSRSKLVYVESTLQACIDILVYTKPTYFNLTTTCNYLHCLYKKFLLCAETLTAYFMCSDLSTTDEPSSGK